MKKNSKAFTLIELMVAIAIIAILSAVVMVQFQGYAKNARASKALAEVSSTMPAIYSCWGNGGDVAVINAAMTWDGYICSLGLSYGLFPKSLGDLSTYSYWSPDTNASNCSPATLSSCPGCTCIPKNAYSFQLYSEIDQKKICCNSAMKGCKLMDNYSQSCVSNDPAY